MLNCVIVEPLNSKLRPNSVFVKSLVRPKSRVPKNPVFSKIPCSQKFPCSPKFPCSQKSLVRQKSLVLGILRRSSTLSCLMRTTRHHAAGAARLPRKDVVKNITSIVEMRSPRWGFTAWAARFRVCAGMISQSSWGLRDWMGCEKAYLCKYKALETRSKKH